MKVQALAHKYDIHRSIQAVQGAQLISTNPAIMYLVGGKTVSNIFTLSLSKYKVYPLPKADNKIGPMFVIDYRPNGKTIAHKLKLTGAKKVLDLVFMVNYRDSRLISCYCLGEPESLLPYYTAYRC